MLIGLVLSVAAAVALLLFNESRWRDSMTATTQVETAQQMRLGIGRLMRAVVDAETGQRGFLLTGEPAYLEPYRRAQGEIDLLLAQLDSMLAEPSEDRELFTQLRHFLSLKQQEIELTVRLRAQGRDDAWRFVVGSDVGQEHMAQVRSHAERLIDSGNAHIDKAFRQIRHALLLSRIGIAAMVLLSLAAFYLYLRQTQAMLVQNRRAQQQLQEERDRLEVQVRERTARLRELATHLQQVREEERGFLARELHDELGALLTAAKLDVARIKSRVGPHSPDAQERLDHLTATLNSGIALKRRIVEDLRPSSLSHLGLVASLEILASEFAERSELKMHTELQAAQLPGELEITLYRLVQESLTNVGKYAQARQVWVRLLPDGAAGVRVEVEDDGQGFDPAQVGPSRHGLAGMRHRVEAQGGQLQVLSQPGQGTRIVARLPAAQAAPRG